MSIYIYTYTYTYLFRQVEQFVMKEHLLRLSPGAVDDDDIMFYSPCFFGFNQFLQVLRLWTWKQNYCPAVPAHGSQLWMPE